jgi:predicted ferric reductase
VIMISAGTGIAPMRGFIEERAALAEASSHKLGKAILYFGCRDHERDYIYAEQLRQWEQLGAVDVRPTFSQRGPEGAGSTGMYTSECGMNERSWQVCSMKGPGYLHEGLQVSRRRAQRVF